MELIISTNEGISYLILNCSSAKIGKNGRLYIVYNKYKENPNDFEAKYDIKQIAINKIIFMDVL